MSRYTYTLNPNRIEMEKNTYRQSELEKMTMFHLREICRKEKLVVPTGSISDREALIRILMRLERLGDYMQTHELKPVTDVKMHFPGTILLYEDTGLNELDNYQVRTDGALYEGNLLLVDEKLHVYTCFYITQTKNSAWLAKGKDVPVKDLEKHQYSLLYFPNEMIAIMGTGLFFQDVWKWFKFRF